MLHRESTSPGYAVRMLKLAAIAMLWSAGLAVTPAQNRPERDWTQYPAIVEIDTAEDIFAVGDAHGDHKRLARALAGARIIARVPESPDQPDWIAGKAVVVSTGDMIDKGPHALKVIALLRGLRDAARRAGGAVVILAGNHEVEFLVNPGADKVADFAAELRVAGLSGKEVADCRGDLGQFLCSLPFAARVGSWFFSHAGNSGGRTLARLAADIEHGVAQDGFRTAELVGANSLLEARLGTSGPRGKSWFEAEAPVRNGKQLLKDYADAMGVAHIVEGHQPAGMTFESGVTRRAGTMFQMYGRIFLIDTGMSHGVGNSAGAVLHIRRSDGQQATAVCPSGKTTLLWDEKHGQKTGRAAPCRP